MNDWNRGELGATYKWLSSKSKVCCYSLKMFERILHRTKLKVQPSWTETEEMI